MTSARPLLHHNPVYSGYFADPFVWKSGQTYYAIGTGHAEAEGKVQSRIFPILRSQDFAEWEPAGQGLIPPDPSLGINFWAPAVAENSGLFYLYYSVGFGDKNHQLRVAVSAAPAGPYEDLGTAMIPLSECGFAIDPHPFRDGDGRWYLFYARDYLDLTPAHRVGTALAARRMKTSMVELEGPEIPILRAQQDWQRFEENRPMYGTVWDWHTLEGPCPWLHDGKYYCFYSGGRWENDTYGVDYGVADSILGPYLDSGNEKGPRVLRTLPGKVIGPGHNTVVTGPDGNDYLAYHAWDPGMTARRMRLSRIDWSIDGPRLA